MNKVKLAILDMNNNVPNQGLRCICELADRFSTELEWKVFDVRAKNELPDLSYDLYISSGGPGSPLEKGPWRQPYLQLVDRIVEHNHFSEHDKKYMFFICYSFQLACHHFQLAEVSLRRKTSFGVYPVHKTKAGEKDNLLQGLNDPYFVVDSRDWQVVQPRLKRFEEKGATILSLEKIRTHVEYERAIMAVRFSPYHVGTQFHPEADPEGLKVHFSEKENKNKVIENFNLEKYETMMNQIDEPEKIAKTHQILLPNFIRSSLKKIREANLQYS